MDATTYATTLAQAEFDALVTDEPGPWAYDRVLFAQGLAQALGLNDDEMDEAVVESAYRAASERWDTLATEMEAAQEAEFAAQCAQEEAQEDREARILGLTR